MGMFDRYIQLEGTSAHSNLVCFPCMDKEPTIVIGSTSIITFNVPALFLKNYEEEIDLKNVKLLIYKEATLLEEIGDETLEIYLSEDGKIFSVSYTMSAEDTLKFKDYKLIDTFIQLVFDYYDATFVSEVFKVKVIDSLVQKD